MKTPTLRLIEQQFNEILRYAGQCGWRCLSRSVASKSMAAALECYAGPSGALPVPWHVVVSGRLVASGALSSVVFELEIGERTFSGDWLMIANMLVGATDFAPPPGLSALLAQGRKSARQADIYERFPTIKHAHLGDNSPRLVDV